MAAPATLDQAVTSVAGTQPVFAQTMLRVNEPEASISFYEGLGLQYIGTLPIPEYKFSLYFLAALDSNTPPPPAKDAPRTEVSKYLWSLRCPTLELTHNWPGDDPPETYVSGNEPPRGYGHLAFSGVPVPDAATKDPAALPSETASIVTDPDGYAVKLVGTSAAPGDTVYARTMLRVSDPGKSVRFFERLGMRRLGVVNDDDLGITHYFMGYSDTDAPSEGFVDWLASFRAPVVHLQHAWRNPEEKLVNGNEKPFRGFGHLGVIVNDIYTVTKSMEEFGYGVVRKPSPILDVGEIAFVKDDTVGYWVELIQRSNEPADKPYVKS